MIEDILNSLKEVNSETEQRRDLTQQVMESNLLSALSIPQSPVGISAQQRKQNTDVKKPGVPIGAVGGRKGAFLKSISIQESGGSYDAVGVPTDYGTAYGKYQILDSNFVGAGGWDKEALGRDISLNNYLNSPKLQEKIARHKLLQYFNQYGPTGAAKAWYAGPGNAYTDSDASQYGGPSINDYAAAVVSRMKDILRRR